MNLYKSILSIIRFFIKFFICFLVAVPFLFWSIISYWDDKNDWQDFLDFLWKRK